MSSPFLRWPPSRISAIALVLAALAGVFAASARWLGPWVFLPVALLVFVSGFFDVIDGAVARLTHQASARGDFLDHVFDRYADIFIVVGLAVSSFANPILAMLALVSLLLTS
ncbi:MAG: CDP-alcohol phosphatidyltransferase family protein, partial [Thermoplasmata archaeon]